MYPKLISSIEQIAQKASISEERLELLTHFSDLVLQELNKRQKCNLNFICTHNSRRSHLSQIWAWVMSRHFKLDGVHCYSGGTEATALFPLVQKVLIDQGIQSDIIGEKQVKNPIYYFKISEEISPLIGFSKKYEDAFNPSQHFIAVMTCAHASENCPLVLGADTKIALTYEDPKAFDQTALQLEKYQERSAEIAAEMFTVFKSVSEKRKG